MDAEVGAVLPFDTEQLEDLDENFAGVDFILYLCDVVFREDEVTLTGRRLGYLFFAPLEIGVCFLGHVVFLDFGVNKVPFNSQVLPYDLDKQISVVLEIEIVEVNLELGTLKVWCRLFELVLVPQHDQDNYLLNL